MFDADLDAAVIGRGYRGKGCLRLVRERARLFKPGTPSELFCRIVV
jgi:hypothetical protein